jgi:hypothetical protein
MRVLTRHKLQDKFKNSLYFTTRNINKNGSKSIGKAGYTDVNIVQNKQNPMEISNCVSPNPEEPEALTMALALADKDKC